MSAPVQVCKWDLKIGVSPDRGKVYILVMPSPQPYPRLDAAAKERLAQRVGRLHLWQRQGIQKEHVDALFFQGRTLFNIENWHLGRKLLRLGLQALGLYERGRRNARDIRILHNHVELPHLPPCFDGFRLLQLTDLHLDMDRDITHALYERVRDTQYDLCVITGDIRARTFGNIDECLRALATLRAQIATPVYLVLGNHDFIEMVPAIEDMGIRVLLNESTTIEREGRQIHIAGVDDPHFYAADNLEKAGESIPLEAVAILLSHSPDLVRHAAHAGFDLMLSGHTHGGQICLPGGIALTYHIKSPRRFGRGAWHHNGMQGYTSHGAGASIVPVRFNCPPEITIHHLVNRQASATTDAGARSGR